MRSIPSEIGTRDALLDIRDNILLARQFVQGIAFDVFKVSRLHFYATTRAVQIISEASRRLPDELRACYPNLPWRTICDAGNLYWHEYGDVAESRIWTTVHDEMTPLLAAVEVELSVSDDQP